MADWFYGALEAFASFMEDTDGATGLWLALVATFGCFLLVLVHEIGHLVAALALGAPVRRLRVGGTPNVTIGRGRFRLELSLRDDPDCGGFVEFGPGVSPRRIAIIALAGPAADLASTAGLLLAAPHTHGLLYLLAVLAALSAAWNLWPRGSLTDDSGWNDGRVAQVAWMIREYDPEEDEDFEPEPTSVPPPPRAVVAPAGPRIRAPFIVVLVAAAGISLIVTPLTVTV